MKVSHLYFVDDLLLFTETGADQIDCIKEGLSCFCKVSGQKINFNKSLMFVSLNVDEQEALMLSRRVGIPRTEELGQYLGHQLIHKERNNGIRGRLLQRLKDKLDGWKTRCLFRAGQFTLMKEVISSLRIFHMQIQKLPSKIHKELDKSIR